ncbi:MAG: hypothetical protein KDC54_12745, partial [Lewinella sp.]|nr:hypothetical protein [Lewinella sp.]
PTLLLGLLVGLVSCQPPVPAAESTPAPDNQTEAMPAASAFQASSSLSDYWYQGKAELNFYDLEQNRYQSVHSGQAILIFVTEDFLTDKQVKNDQYQNSNSTLVLKTNAIRRFTTGLYDYSVMTSVFTPVKNEAFPFTLKVTNTSQDWCGQTYSQVNWQGHGYREILHSYFENEADQEVQTDPAILEDELYNRIRLGWESLPTGEQAVIPSLMHLRLAHRPFAVETARLSLDDYTGDTFVGEQLKVYRIDYAYIQRQVAIVFEAEPPYRIVGWTETFPSAFDGELRTTVARLRQSLLEPYWKMNDPSYQPRRDSLGLYKFH